MVDYRKFYSSLAKAVKASEIRELLALIRGRKDIISFAGGIPDPVLFPKERLSKIAEEVIIQYGNDALQYSETKGILEARETISDFLLRKKSIVADAEQIIITSGSQQALDLIARVFIDPGDIIITESPSYLAALGAFKNAWAKIIGVKIDDYGMRTDILEDALRKMSPEERRRAKLIYTIPVGHNPAGVTMNGERKRHLLEIASQYDLLIVEDDPYSYITYEDADVSSLKSIDREDRVIYLSTISKILAPGLRLGWIVANPDIIRMIELLKQYTDLHSPTLNQFILAEAIKRGVIDEVIARAVPHYKVKRDAMLEAIRENFPDYTWYSRPVGGLFVFTYVYKDSFLADILLEKAVKEYKVAYVPGGSFHPDGTGRNSMRLNFSFPSPEQIREGIARLAKLIKEV